MGHDSALIARVPEVEPIIGRWRARFDSSAPFGVPAHVTVLFPFMPSEEIDNHVKFAVGEIIGEIELMVFSGSRWETTERFALA